MTNPNPHNAENPADCDARRTAAIKRLEAANSADPRKHPHGFLSRDDMSGGVSMFHWYASRAARLESIATDLPLLMDEDDPELTTAIRNLAADQAHDSDGKLLTSLHAQLQGLQEMIWIGTFDELRSSTAEWPREVRSEFRSQEEEDADAMDRPVASDELGAFVDFLQEFGC